MGELFHAYDIRGTIREINRPFTKKLGNALAHYFKTGKLIVGYDARKNSEDLSKILSETLSERGFEVENIGLSSTPYFYHCINEAKAQGGIMITASHLPKDKNGFKICGENARMIAIGTGLEEIKNLFDGNKAFRKKKGSIKETEYFDSYKKHFGDKTYRLNIQVDCSNGTGNIEANILSEIFPNIKIINHEPNIEGAAHSLNPLEEDAQAQAKIEAHKYDFSVIFDADADRAVFIDSKGKTLAPDLTGMLLSKKYHQVVRDISCTKFLDGNRKMIISKVGRANIAKAMEDHNADFGFEASGHVFYKKFYSLDNPALAVLDMAEYLVKNKTKLHKIWKRMPKYYSIRTQIEGNINLQDISQKLKKLFKGEENWLDGLTYDMGDAYINLRASNTEPITRVTIEAISKRKFNRLKRNILGKSKPL